mgnify:CR=1 FL=1
MNRLIVALGLVTTLTTLPPAFAADEYSAAEQRVFIDNHMKNVAKETTVEYRYVQTGKPEDGFEDAVKLVVGKGAADKRTLAVEYLSGKRKMDLPSIDGATGNPVILYFLEDDIRAMHDRLGGQQAYFRKRIRLALADAATVKPVKLSYRGTNVDGSEVTIEPYVNDALKDRFGAFASKVYVFTMSDAVPGGVYEIRTRVEASTGSTTTPAVTTSMKIVDTKP